MKSKIGSLKSDNCEPPFEAWPNILQSNLAAQTALTDRFDNSCFEAMRSQILAAARSFTDELNSIATDAGLVASQELPQLNGETSSLARLPIVASGHQPIIFHPGIIAKNVRLEQLANENDALGLLILIDTDDGNASKFVFPTSTKEKPFSLQTASFGRGGDLFLSQSIGEPASIANVSEQVQKSLIEFGFTDPANRAAIVMDQYRRLSGRPTAVANSIIRRIWENQPSYLEVPLSKIVSLPSIRTFFDSLFDQAETLHEIYNSTLMQYRTDHKIRNRANPFPNLASEGESIELPFWVLDVSQGTRIPLTVHRNAPLKIAPSMQVVPRGMMITTLLRLVCSDFFIHGTGGAKYDKCTDQFVSSMFQIEAPEFVATTASRHLFEDELNNVAKSRALRDQVQEVYGRFQRHTESGMFKNSDQENALDLLARRTDAISRLKTAKTARQPASEINVELKAINAEILEFVERVVTKGELLVEPDRETLQVLENRTFPYFFFPNS